MKTFTIWFHPPVSSDGGHGHRVQATSWKEDGPWLKFFDTNENVVLSAKKEDIVYVQDTTLKE